MSTSAIATPNTDPYPGVALVKDLPTSQALRLLWSAIAALKAQVQGPKQGTLQPDQKPGNLTPRDAGVLFFATDYNRTFIWLGQAWGDLPSAPTRFQVGFFGATPEPSIGWFLCDGSTVPRSTSTGGILAFPTPVIPAYSGLRAWIRL